MNKTEFLTLLERRLIMLNNAERDDLISEYTQHIDMKVASGLSEEDAIADFGDPEELIKELLDVYHLNPNYNPNAVYTTEYMPDEMLTHNFKYTKIPRPDDPRYAKPAPKKSKKK